MESAVPVVVSVVMGFALLYFGQRAEFARMRRFQSDEAAQVPAADLLEALPDGVLLIDADGVITMTNRRVEELFRATRSDLVGHLVEELVPERFRGIHVAHRARYAQRSVVRPMGVGRNLVGLRSDGTEFPADISLGPILRNGHSLTVAVVRDVTERRAEERVVARGVETAHIAVAVEAALKALNEGTVPDPGTHGG